MTWPDKILLLTFKLRFNSMLIFSWIGPQNRLPTWIFEVWLTRRRSATWFLNKQGTFMIVEGYNQDDGCFEMIQKLNVSYLDEDKWKHHVISVSISEQKLEWILHYKCYRPSLKWDTLSIECLENVELQISKQKLTLPSTCSVDRASNVGWFVYIC